MTIVLLITPVEHGKILQKIYKCNSGTFHAYVNEHNPSKHTTLYYK